MTANTVLAAFLDRVRARETRDDLLYHVTRTVVFRSYLTDVPMPGDVDAGSSASPSSRRPTGGTASRS